MIEQGIDRKALYFLISPNPDFDWLRRYPSRAAGKDWREVEPMARRFVHDHKSAQHFSNLDIAGRQVVFLEAQVSYEGTKFSLMIPADAVELTDVEQPVADVLVARGTRLHLPDWPQNLVLGSDAWKDQEGQRLWFIAPDQKRQVSRPLVNCVRTILTLGEKHLTTLDHMGHA